MVAVFYLLFTLQRICNAIDAFQALMNEAVTLSTVSLR